MLFSKFIIEDDKLIFSKCNLHKELVRNEKKVQGGGLFKFIYDTQTELIELN